MPFVPKLDWRSTVPGPQGPQGHPGVNAVENDTAIAAYIKSALSATWAALVSLFVRKDEFDPRAYGAVGNRVVDDTEAIRACVAAAGVGGAIAWPWGFKPKVTGTIDLLDGQGIRGRWTRASEVFTTSDIPVFRITGGQNQSIRQIRVQNWFVGDRTTYDIDVTNPTNVVLQDVEIDLATGSRLRGGIRLRRDAPGAGENAFMPRLSRIWVRRGHLVVDGVTDGHFVDGYVWATSTGGRAAIDMFNISNGWSFQSVDVIPPEGTGAGFRLEQTWDTKINGGYVDGSYTDQDTGYGIVVVNGGELFVAGTNLYHLGRSGVRLEGSSGCTFTAVGYARNNKQNNGYPDIELIGSSYNTFLGGSHSQRVNRTVKGAIYREDSTSLHNSLDESVANLTGGDNYAKPLFVGNEGTLGARNRPMSLWPRPTGTPTVIAPQGCMMGGFTTLAWPAANRAQFHKFELQIGVVARFSGFRAESAGGNVQVAVVKMNGLNYTRVMVSAITAVGAAGAFSLDMGSTFLPPGEYALVFWADNTTLTLAQAQGELIRSTRLCGEATGLTTGIPAAGAIPSWSTTRAVAGLTLTASA